MHFQTRQAIIEVILSEAMAVADDGPRCISQNISSAAGLALIGHAITWRWSEFSFCVHVGHGIGINTTREKVQWIISPTT
jgi:hypothetical protein